MNPNTDTSANTFKGLFYSLGGAILLATTWVIGKYALGGFNVETFVVVWMSSAAAGALVIIVVTGQAARLALPGNAVSGILLLGLATGAGMITGWAGLKRLDPSFSAFIWRSLPVLGVLLGVVFLREKMTIFELLPMAVMFLGGCLGTIGRWHIVGTGVVLTLFACCATAVQLLIAKIEVTRVHPTIMVFYRNGIAAVLMGAWMILTGKAGTARRLVLLACCYTGGIHRTVCRLHPDLPFLPLLGTFARQYGNDDAAAVRPAPGIPVPRQVA